MQLSLSPLLTLLLFSLASPVACQQTEEHKNETLLEVRLTTPGWEKGYLKIGVDRINHSSIPLYLPDEGVYISLAVNEAATEIRKNQEMRWVNIHGVTDIISWEAKPIAPGTTVHKDYYLRSAFAVVDLKKETRREIPVRGKLRVEAFYFLSEQDWQKNKHYHEEIVSEHSKPWKRPDFLKPESATAYVGIPCHEVGCTAKCNNLPLVLPDENRIVPDVYSFDEEANVRGKAISDKLAGKSPACSEDAQPTN